MIYSNQWHLVQADPEDDYIDFDKEIFSFPDEGNTSIDIRLSFIRSKGRAYSIVSLHNNDGHNIEVGREIHLTWTDALAMLGDEAQLPEWMK